MKKTLESLAIEANVIPTLKQTLLLKACLLEGEPAMESFLEWVSGLQVEESEDGSFANIGLPRVYDQLDMGSQRLLPLLYKNLTRQGFKHPVTLKIRGFYKFSWYRNSLLRAQFAELNERFRKSGIEFIIIKGIAQVEKYYEDGGARLTHDIDLVIKREDIDLATDELVALGCTFHPVGNPRQLTQSQNHAHTFYRNHFEIDLHIQFSMFALKPETENIFWTDSVQMSEGYRVLCPAHELFLTILHAFQWNNISPIRWVADSAGLIARFTHGDWNQFYSLVQSENINVHFQAFRYLIEYNFAEIPGNVYRLLEGKQNNYYFEWQLRCALVSPHVHLFRDPKRVLYKIGYVHKNFSARVWALKDHYLYEWGQDSVMGLLTCGFLKLARKLNKLLSGQRLKAGTRTLMSTQIIIALSGRLQK